MNVLYPLPRETIDDDPAGYLEYRTRSIIRELLDTEGCKAKARLMQWFDEESTGYLE